MMVRFRTGFIPDLKYNAVRCLWLVGLCVARTGPIVGDHDLGGVAAPLLTHQVNSDISEGKIKPNAPPAPLYDPERAPAKKADVYDQFPEVVEELQGPLQESLEDLYPSASENSIKPNRHRL